MLGLATRKMIGSPLLAGLSLVHAACGAEPAARSSTPVAPSAPQPASIVLSGYVDDTAFKPLLGVTVEVLDGPEAGRSTVTDQSGNFSMTGNLTNLNRLRATKEGYGAAIQTYQPKLTFFLSASGLSGNTAILTVEADPACTELPSNVRKRTYPATIAADPFYQGNSMFIAYLTGAALDSYFRFVALRVGGDQLMFDLSDNGIEEEVDEDAYLFVGGVAYGVLRAGATTISAQLGPGGIDYCVLKSDPGSAYPCTDQAIARVQCLSGNNRLTLTWQ